MPLLIPTIHLNGTPRQYLEDEAVKAYEALATARDAIRQITIHGRDFYPQGDSNAIKPRECRDELIGRLERIMTELADYAWAIKAGGAGAVTVNDATSGSVS